MQAILTLEGRCFLHGVREAVERGALASTRAEGAAMETRHLVGADVERNGVVEISP